MTQPPLSPRTTITKKERDKEWKEAEKMEETKTGKADKKEGQIEGEEREGRRGAATRGETATGAL